MQAEPQKQDAQMYQIGAAMGLTWVKWPVASEKPGSL
jgi:hypothetical protein